MSRRSYTPNVPLPAAERHGQRRSTGGARREASERVVLRAGDSEVMGWTLNVSRGGVRIIVEDAVELGKEYRVVLGEGEASPRPGRVVWLQDEADGQIAGVQFLDVEGAAPPANEDKPPPAGDDSGSAGP